MKTEEFIKSNNRRRFLQGSITTTAILAATPILRGEAVNAAFDSLSGKPNRPAVIRRWLPHRTKHVAPLLSRAGVVRRVFDFSTYWYMYIFSILHKLIILVNERFHERHLGILENRCLIKLGHSLLESHIPCFLLMRGWVVSLSIFSREIGKIRVGSGS